MLNEHLAIEVVDLVLQADREQALRSQGKRGALRIKRTHHDLPGTLDVFKDARHRQAALFVNGGLAARFDDFGIDEDLQGIAGLGKIDHDHPKVHIDLRGSKADAWSVVHGFGHVSNQLANRVIDLLDRTGELLQPGIGVAEDCSDCHSKMLPPAQGGRKAKGAGRSRTWEACGPKNAVASPARPRGATQPKALATAPISAALASTRYGTVWRTPVGVSDAQPNHPQPSTLMPCPHCPASSLTPQPACARAWLALHHTASLTAPGAYRLGQVFGGACGALAAPYAALAAVVGPAAARALLEPDPERSAAVDRALEWAAQPGQHLICRSDPRYPATFDVLSDPPPVLFVCGNPQLLSLPALAVVGSRHASRDGLRLAQDLASGFARAGVLVVSGMAAGIDSAAHAGAMAAGGPTLAFIGTGADLVYPESNRSLARAIIEQGALVSEFPLGSPAIRHHFPQRNRLIAALCSATVVVQAARHSGSLITARLAAEFGREVMAVPGSVQSALSKGCHQLIREGAALVEDGAEVAALFSAALSRQGRPWPGGGPTGQQAYLFEGKGAFESNKPSPAILESGEGARVLDALGWSPAHPDVLASSAGLSVAQTAAALVELELSGLIERMLDGRVQRIGNA